MGFKYLNKDRDIFDGDDGKDVLLEHGANGLFEMLDLGITKCKLMVG
jgi:hypothetical protein